MRTLRRLYVYGISLISLEVVLWGLIGLLRTMVSRQAVGGTEQLAQALALILVGVPVFGLHWYLAQRGARNEPQEERFSVVRAVFLYLALLFLLVPVAQNTLAMVGRGLARWLDVPLNRALLDGSQTLSDNLIAIFLNGVLAFYFFKVLEDDWAAFTPPAVALPVVRRIYRYVWVLYGLGMSLLGVQRILRYLLALPSPSRAVSLGVASLSNGLALLVVGLPVWYYTWGRVQRSLAKDAERRSLLRAIVLFLLTLFGLLMTLGAGGAVLAILFEKLLGGYTTLPELIGDIGGPLSMALPMLGVWAYHRGWLLRSLDALESRGWREGLGRTYALLLSLAGLAATVGGAAVLLSFLVDVSVGGVPWGSGMRERLSGGLSLVAVGLPLWAYAWRGQQSEALREDERGARARRSLLRRGYLYLVLFVGVMGGMASAVRLLFVLLNAFLGGDFAGFGRDFLDSLQFLVIFGVLLGYHWSVLRTDSVMEKAPLARRYADFLVGVVGETGFAQGVADAIHRRAAQIPVRPLAPQGEAIPEGVRLLILPRSLLVNSPEDAPSAWKSFAGPKIVFPDETPGWVWAPDGKDVAGMVQRLAEGEPAGGGTRPVWMIVLYVLGALFGLQIAISLLMALLGVFLGG